MREVIRARRTRTGRAVLVVTTDLLRATLDQAAEVLADVCAMQTTVFSASSGIAPGQMKAMVSDYVRASLDPSRYDRYNRATVVRDDQGLLACAQCFVSRVDAKGRTCEIVRGNFHVAERGRSEGLVSLVFGATVLPYALRHPLATMPRYYFGSVMSPVSYHITARRSRVLFPGPEPVPEAMLDVYEALTGERHGRPRTQPVRSGVDPRTERWLERTDSQHVAFYLDRNPRFREGFGLPVLVRLDGVTLIYALGRTAASWRRGRRLGLHAATDAR